MWNVKRSHGVVNIEFCVHEDGSLVEYELCGYVSVFDGTFNSVTGRHIPAHILSQARAQY